MSWTTTRELKEKLLKMWESGKLLRSEREPESLFPLSLKLKGPSSGELSARFSEVSDWIAGLKREPFELIWHTTNHRVIGSNKIPTHVVFISLDEVCRFLRRSAELRIYRNLLERTAVRCPVAVEWLYRRPILGLQFSEVWDCLLDIVEWVLRNPGPELYLRQVDLPGVDTKFFEMHKGVLSELFELALPPSDSHTRGKSFERRFGFHERPVRVRWRPLAPGSTFRGFTELTVRREDFVLTDPGFSKVVVVENEINFLTFPSIKDAMVVFGSGYKVGALKGVPWMVSREVYYWGDIDTHGFAILDQFRGYYPQAVSILMDRSTFLAHRGRWVNEGRQVKAPLTRLTDDEQSLYQALLHEEYGVNLRLEQELIGFSLVQAAADRIAFGD